MLPPFARLRHFIKFLFEAEILTPRKVAFTASIVGLALLVFVVVEEKGTDAPSTAQYESMCAQLEREVADLRARLDQREKTSPAESDEAGIALMHELLVAHNRWRGECKSGTIEDPFYSVLRRRYETHLAAPLAAEALEREKAGNGAVDAGDYATAIREYALALRLRERIDTEFPASEQTNTALRQSLERRLKSAVNAPVTAEIRSANDAAFAALDAGNLAAARDHYSSLLARLRQLSQQPKGDWTMDFEGETRRTEEKVADISARIRSENMEKAASEGEALAASGDVEGASASFSRAIALQRSIEVDFPQSRLARDSVMNELELRRQRALSGPLFARLDQSIESLEKLLAAGAAQQDVTAGIGEARQIASEILRNYPRVGLMDDPRMVRISFLHNVREDAAAIRRAFVEHLIPVPGRANVQMMDREVSQLLFTRICGHNPSSRKGDELPVEGVTLDEALNFAQRLSWIMGREVSLPSLDEFLAALGKPDSGIRTGTWNSTSAPGREIQAVGSSKANSSGFYDLLGNVSEWVRPDQGDSSGSLIFGGSVRDNPLRLAEIPQERRNAAERVRNNGLRVVVR
jgi:hypothetical protein